MNYKDISQEQDKGGQETPTSKVIRTSDHTPHAIMFWEPPTIISPSAANCWTAYRILINRGPKHRPPPTFPDARRSISAVSRMTLM
jgi:hypothetical protein